MNCPNCNAENMESAKFCLKCGTPLTGDFVTYEPKMNEEKPAIEEVKQEQINPEESSQPSDYNPFKMIMPENYTQPQETKFAEDAKTENNFESQNFNPEKAVTPENSIEPQEIKSEENSQPKDYNPFKMIMPEYNTDNTQPQEVKPAENAKPEIDFEPQEFKPVMQKEEKPKEPKVRKKMNKGLKTALIVVAVIVVLVGGFRLIFPREFYQLVMNDSQYNKYLLTQEMKSIKNSAFDVAEDGLKEKSSYSYETGMSVELGDSAVQMLPEGSSDFAASLADYLNTVKFKGETTVNGLDSKQKVQITDNNGTLLTLNAVQNGSVQYYNINELSGKWFKVSPQGYQVNNITNLINEYQKMNEEEKQLKSSASELSNTLLSIYDVADIEITGNQTLTIGNESVTGDKSSVTVTAAQLLSMLDKTEKQAKNDTELYNALKSYYNKTLSTNSAFAKTVDKYDFKFSREDYNKYITEIFNAIKDEIKTTELRTLTIDQYINRKNEIIGVQFKFNCLKKEDNLFVSYINNKKESAPQIAFDIRPEDLKQDKEYILFQLKGEDKQNGTASAEFKIDGDSGKVNAVYKDLEQKGNFLLGQIDVSFSGFNSDSSEADVFKDMKISYKSAMADKTNKVTFTLDAGDYGKIALNTAKKNEKAKDIKPVTNAIELLNGDDKLTSEASKELQSGMEDFYTDVLAKHKDLTILIQEGVLLFSSSELGDDGSGFSAAADEDYSDYSGLLGAG